MLSHLAVFVAGIIVATIGIVPIAKMADNGVQKIQAVVKDATE
jgi:hypothetical protein